MSSIESSGLTDYRLLGRSGLRVSPLTLGAMGFGWWLERDVSQAIFTRYLEAGGNVVDTADFYGGGKSEEFVGDFIQETHTRDRVVLSTKFSFNVEDGNPNAGGNGRKNIRRAIEASLRRLKTDYIDLYYLHLWDRFTPIEEVLTTLNDLVREGKVLHIGMSNVPAWYVARAQTIAEQRGYEGIAALQLEYSVIARTLEREHLPVARELGIAVCPFHPLSLGFLSGRYQRAEGDVTGEGRLQQALAMGVAVFDKFISERSWKILDRLRAAAEEIGRSPAEIALRWVTVRPGVVSTLLGVSSKVQLDASIKALDFEIPSTVLSELEAVGALDASDQDPFFGPALQSMVNGNTRVRALSA